MNASVIILVMTIFGSGSNADYVKTMSVVAPSEEECMTVAPEVAGKIEKEHPGYVVEWACFEVSKDHIQASK